jgi:hypothetical protein
MVPEKRGFFMWGTGAFAWTQGSESVGIGNRADYFQNLIVVEG